MNRRITDFPPSLYKSEKGLKQVNKNLEWVFSSFSPEDEIVIEKMSFLYKNRILVLEEDIKLRIEQ